MPVKKAVNKKKPTKSSEPKLEPCPFCGSNDVNLWEFITSTVDCHKCNAHGPRAATRREAVTKWNNVSRKVFKEKRNEERQQSQMRPLPVALQSAKR